MDSRRLVALALCAVVALIPLSVADPVHAEAAALPYLALGDSVAFGTDAPDGIGYPTRLGRRLTGETGQPVELVNRARAGERTAGVLATQLDDLAQVAPRLVTLTVGANDFLVPTVECLASRLDGIDDHCAVPDPFRALPAFEANLRATLDRLVTETDATIVVTTYYNPFPRGSRCVPALADLSLGFLNERIGSVAREYGERVIVVDLLPVFRGHEGRGPTGWFAENPVRVSCADIHPNVDGQEAIADAIWESLSPRLAQIATGDRTG